jgi:hypothetical protein
MMGFAIIDGNYRDYKFEISLPRLNESKFSLDVDMELAYVEKPLEDSWRDTLGMNKIKTVVLRDLKHRVDYNKCRVYVDFESALPDRMLEIERITVKVDYKRTKATVFKAFEKEQDIYNRVSDHQNMHKWKLK